MQNAQPYGKTKKKKKKNNQAPTTIPFWRIIKQKQPKGPGGGNVEVIYPDNSRQIINPFKGAPKISPCNLGQNIGSDSQDSNTNVTKRNDPDQLIFSEDHIESNFPDNLKQKNQPMISSKPIQFHTSSQNIGPGNTAKSIRPSNPGQSIRPSNSGQPIRPGNPGQPIRPNNPGQPIRPSIPGQPVRPAKPKNVAKPNVKGNSGQQNLPVKPNQASIAGKSIAHDNSDKLNQPGKLGQTNQPTGKPGQTNQPTDKPDQKKQLTDKPGQTNQPANKPGQTNQPTNKPGQGPKFKPLKEVKQPGDKASKDGCKVSDIPVPQAPPPPTAATTMLQNTDSPIITIVGKNKVNPVSQQKKILKFQMRMQTIQLEKQRQAKNVRTPIIPREHGTANTFANPYVGLPNPAGMPQPTGMGAPSYHENQNMMAVPHTREVVETVFHTDHHQASFTQPLPTSIPQQPLNTNSGSWSYDPYGFKYPKGIPKSFLLQQKKQQQQAQSQQTSVPDNMPIWPTGELNAPKSVQRPANAPNAASPLVVQTDSQGEAPQPYSPSELYSDLDQAHGPAASGQTKKKNQFVPFHTWSKRLQDAYSEARLKFIIWSQHNRPKTGPIYQDMIISRKIFKSRKSALDKLRGEKNAADDVKQLDDSEALELSQSCQKRLSAFRRLGPQTQPKKPKLTISLTVNDDQEVREVVDETEEEEEITPVHLRADIIISTDETVMKYLKAWPWKRNVVVKRSVTARNSKTVMMLEREQMEEIYEKDTLFLQITVKGYPPTWKKEQVLDTLLENIRGYSFIPCFIEFNQRECKFLTLRCRSALLSLHKCGFIIRKDDVELILAIAQTELTLTQLDFIPRLVLRKRLHMCADGGNKLDLSEFTLKEDISHFIYFPLSRLNNQTELVQMQSDVTWLNLTDLNLSHNKISSLDGFDLERMTPQLKRLNLSYNYIEKITSLLKCRELPLKSIHLEGNPLCTDYRDPDHYVRVVKMMFSSVVIIDDIPIKLKGEMPKFIRNYCPADAEELVEKFLEVYFPLIDGDIEHRAMLRDMYDNDANMTVTYNYKMGYSPIFRCFKTLFQQARQLEQDNMTMIKGCQAITTAIASWPHTEHDRLTFNVDVIYHNDVTTILRIDGMLKLTRESLADDEYLLAFSRTLVLHTRDYVEYKIVTEMLHWSVPTGAYAKSAFAVTAIEKKQMYPKIDSTTDEKLQGDLLKIFMQLTTMDKKTSERCLEIKKWNLKEALEHFSKLLKLDSLESIMKDVS